MGPIYTYIKYQRSSQKMMTLINTCGPTGPKEIRVINIRNNIYNKSPLRISFPGGAAQIGSLKVEKWSKLVYLFLTFFN